MLARYVYCPLASATNHFLQLGYLTVIWQEPITRSLQLQY